jgi:hypothetical protein
MRLGITIEDDHSLSVLLQRHHPASAHIYQDQLPA